MERFPGAIILKLSHGYSISPEDQDPLVEIAEEVFTKIISESLVAGKWLVDSIPLRAHWIFALILWPLTDLYMGCSETRT